MVVNAWGLRYVIYSHLAAHGTAPSRDVLVATAGDRTDDLLRELDDRHAILLDEAGEIRMALPFSAIPTDHRVVAGAGSWWANCAWDALAIPALLGVDARIEAEWMGTDDKVDLEVAGGELKATSGDNSRWVHFAIPARRWWDDIVET